MKIKLYRSATVGIETNGFKLLQDPWLTDGEFLGSWSHYPYFDFDNFTDELNSYNAIYISHIHPDHCSEDTLNKLDKNIPVYIHKFHSKFLKFKIERLGFKVIELENNKNFQLSNKVKIKIIAADNCDPMLCFKHIGCADLSVKNGSQQIDTLCVIDDGNEVLVNVNDCPFELAGHHIKKIRYDYDKIDILLTGYQNASAYPQCFENLSLAQKKIGGEIASKKCLDRALSFIKILNPKYYLPFAGTYTLGGQLSVLNSQRYVPTIDEAYDYLEKNIGNKTNIPIKINPETTFDSCLNETSLPFKNFDKKSWLHHIDNYLSKKKYFYENNESIKTSELHDLIGIAHKKWLDKKRLNNIDIKTNILLHFDDQLVELSNDINLKFTNINDYSKKKNYVKFKIDKNLLFNLLKGPRFAHWHNAEIGSHIFFDRNPNIFERNVYFSMSYFHV